MPRVTFQCEVVTPMFLNGANPDYPEIRAASIRGALRWWFRAMKGNEDTGALYQDESAIFGNTDQQSQVWVRVWPGDIKIDCFKEQKATYSYSDFEDYEQILETGKFQNGRLPGEDRGIAFLLFSALQQKRPFIVPGSTFQVRFESASTEVMQAVLKSFWLLTFFGGLGMRSRRGPGSFRVLGRLEGETEPLRFQSRFDTVESLRRFLKNGLDKYTFAVETDQYSTLDPQNIWLLNEKYYNWEDALHDLGYPYEDYRFHHRKTPNISTGANFGFPVLHRSKTTILAGPSANRPRKEEMLERRSSPLLFKVWKGRGDHFFSGLIHLGGILLPSGFKLKEKAGNGYSNHNPDSKQISLFLDEKFPQAINLLNGKTRK